MMALQSETLFHCQLNFKYIIQFYIKAKNVFLLAPILIGVDLVFVDRFEISIRSDPAKALLYFLIVKIINVQCDISRVDRGRRAFLGHCLLPVTPLPLKWSLLHIHVARGKMSRFY